MLNSSSDQSLVGPCRFNPENIDRIPGAGPGVFVLSSRPDGKAIPSIVGRSDSNVALALHRHLGMDDFFFYKLFNSAEQAFLAECALFHDLQPAFVFLHPERPEGTNVKCPRCSAQRTQPG